MPKPGKYAHIVKTLPRLLGDADDPRYQDKVNAVKDAIKAEPDFVMHASSLAKAYVALRIEKAEAAAKLADVNLRLEAVSQLMFNQFEVEGVSTMTVDGRPVSTSLQPYARAENKEAFRQYCLKIPELARQMMLHPSTMKSLINQMLVDGAELPDGVSVYAKQTFRLGSE